jgi:putative colanic acid biosynthesis acetyltransferase WcaF
VTHVDLSTHANPDFDPGRSFPLRGLWVIVEALILLNPMLTSYRLKRWILRLFGAQIGRGVVIKPNVHVKYPWRLELGDHSWIGERSWIDNFVTVRIGSNVCISQGAYLCTGNHDWSDRSFRRFVESITVEDGAWVGAFTRIAPGLTVGEEAVVTLGSVLLSDAEPHGVYTGNPAELVRERRFSIEASEAVAGLAG